MGGVFWRRPFYALCIMPSCMPEARPFYVATAASEPDGAFVFSKTLDGAELKDGQFTFQLAPPAVGSLAFELAAVVRACGRVGYRSDYVKVKGHFLTSSPFF